MRTFFKILFSPVLIVWWLCKLLIRILTIPIVVLWFILKSIAPELTRPLQSIATWLGDLFRLFR